MIEIDFSNKTYICPFCKHTQVYNNSFHWQNVGFKSNIGSLDLCKEENQAELTIYSFKCRNKSCGKICVTSKRRITGEQFDIIPETTYKTYPEYIPEQIRSDYEESCKILEKSPKAAATLMRRCLQGMIRDFWEIKEKSLYLEIEKIKNKVTPTQWRAIDGLRKIGNIGAHMEQDINLIIDIEIDDARKLRQLIELLLEKWYINRYEEELLLNDIESISSDKLTQKWVEYE